MSQAQGFKCSAHASCILGKHHSLVHEILHFMAHWSNMKRRIRIGSLSGPNFAIRTAKMDRSQI